MARALTRMTWSGSNPALPSRSSDHESQVAFAIRSGHFHALRERRIQSVPRLAAFDESDCRDSGSGSGSRGKFDTWSEAVSYDFECRVPDRANEHDVLGNKTKRRPRPLRHRCSTELRADLSPSKGTLCGQHQRACGLDDEFRESLSLSISN